MAKSKITLAERTRKLTGWTRDEYNKQYDILRNKVRRFEKITGSAVKRNVSKELYYITKNRAQDRELSKTRQAILNAPSYSTGACKKVGKRELAGYESYFIKKFGGASAVNSEVRSILNNSTLSTAEKSRALSKWGEKMNRSRAAQHAKNLGESYEPSDIVGSDDYDYDDFSDD